MSNVSANSILFVTVLAGGGGAVMTALESGNGEGCPVVLAAGFDCDKAMIETALVSAS